MQEKLDVYQAKFIMNISQSDRQWGWSLPDVAELLASAHQGLDEEIGAEVSQSCEFEFRHDIIRYICPHGYVIKGNMLHVEVGSNRN